MKLVFLGTKGYIEESSKQHKMHTSTLVSYKNSRILIDCGQDWLGKLDKIKKYKPQAIFITHAHPDHAWGLKDGSPYPVYASKESWNLMKEYKISKEKRVILKAYKKLKFGDLEIELFPVQHSIKCPGNGYKIKGGKKTIFCSGDLIYIKERKKALKHVDCYIGEASSWSVPTIRKADNGELFGHATIKTQITWCEKENIPEAIFTHCGKQIVEMGYKVAAHKLQKLGEEKDVDVKLAYDGMSLIV
ncbi:hypothetical protein A3F66_04230 [candidate division TM6 bacterium RIFCSPHIGHO2_12_FULL_32_22]|nr:MAG: hypothetical protein A3F66_04230 [candidate division TM6 bacterium RIFCSPHIGHO2_12_FULL_32_22]